MKAVFLFLTLAVVFASCESNPASGQSGSRKSDLMFTYLEIRDALLADNPSKAKVAATDMKSELTNSTFVNKAQVVKMDSALSGISSTANLEKQRFYFSDLSKEVISLANSGSFSKQTFYVDYCPMALNGKGTTWLSDKKQIMNPYLGTGMPDCGKIQSTISK